MLLYRDSYYYAHKADDTTFEVIVAKQRQGECKTAYLDYLRAFQVIQSREK